MRVRPTLSDAAGEAVQRVPQCAQERPEPSGYDPTRPRGRSYDDHRMDPQPCFCQRLVNEPYFCWREARCLKERHGKQVMEGRRTQDGA